MVESKHSTRWGRQGRACVGESSIDDRRKFTMFRRGSCGLMRPDSVTSYQPRKVDVTNQPPHSQRSRFQPHSRHMNFHCTKTGIRVVHSTYLQMPSIGEKREFARTTPGVQRSVRSIGSGYLSDIIKKHVDLLTYLRIDDADWFA